jgi:hypothetical protein
MKQQLGLWRILSAQFAENRRDTLVLTGYSVLGGLAPLWMGALIRKWYGQPFSLNAVAGHGEFALYSAALLAPALYTLGRERGAAVLPARDVLLLAGVTLMVFSIAAYAPIATALLGGSPSAGFDERYYAWSTVVIFALSLAFFMAVALLDHARTSPPVTGMAEEQYRSLAADFDRLGGADAAG